MIKEMLKMQVNRSEQYLVDRHNISKANSQIVAYNLVDSDLRFLTGIVSQDDADCILPFLSLQQLGWVPDLTEFTTYTQRVQCWGCMSSKNLTITCLR